MILPAEKELRAALARFTQTRIDHEVCPTGFTSRALEDATYTLCVMTGSHTAEQALLTADTLLEQYTHRTSDSREDEALAA
ncbi:hypothetical protein SAM40697_6861 [Streptomyces ambofaciens]|uniref:DUF5133 domain-containing protein n=1 Tax=Streptomyces ambofaciens TaxID=1889 RepID=Q0JWL0_STRAM|nr:DUF5133 domain-containing protein [Streptomyces ambofaciens]ANB04027.1 hypothetical protein SAM40697_0064 [Streptomyces ambofaciens]ANB10813.1 hypothetical protein SAM40697_6861 [Streptomyces ambofaciens]CAK50917.1 conserved hypothetical protein [Streptomyces ambofaciens]CAK51155.1 conserved hypothetical protein [Streptomyces ambofaciens]